MHLAQNRVAPAQFDTFLLQSGGYRRAGKALGGGDFAGWGTLSYKVCQTPPKRMGFFRERRGSGERRRNLPQNVWDSSKPKRVDAPRFGDIPF